MSSHKILNFCSLEVLISYLICTFFTQSFTQEREVQSVAPRPFTMQFRQEFGLILVSHSKKFTSQIFEPALGAATVLHGRLHLFAAVVAAKVVGTGVVLGVEVDLFFYEINNFQNHKPSL